MGGIWLRIRTGLLAGLCLVALSRPAGAVIVMAGSDYLQTLPGTFFDFGFGPVPLIGDPTGPGLTDTIVQRKTDADLGGGSCVIPIELVQLSLVSVAPITVPLTPPGSLWDVHVQIDHDTPSVGQLTINGGAGGGTFDSFFDVFVDVEFRESGNPVNVIPLPDTHVGPMNAAGNWGPLPSPGQVIVPGPYPDGNANLHPSPPATAAFIDFFPLGSFVHVNPNGQHVGAVAGVPEPSSVALLGMGLLGLVRRRRHA